MSPDPVLPILARCDPTGDPDRVSTAVRDFSSRGALILDGAFDDALLKQLADAFQSRYGQSTTGATPGPESATGFALPAGDKRTMVTVRLEEPFDQPAVIANPTVAALLDQLLGQDHQLNSFGVVVARPGAAAQHVHRDHPGLFAEPLDAMLPCYAATLIVPLVAFTADVGPTNLWPGSHRTTKAAALQQEPAVPVMPLGSALLVDYRLVHGGGANRSTFDRPILYVVYSRPWFRDEANFERQEPLLWGPSAQP